MNLRNIAIIAHVDHGKTTLVDQLLKQSGSFRENQRVAERAMDSNDLEKERGITILAKATSVDWKDTRINIVDTPGHADFGGEVERILSMVDRRIVLVDAAEGPMPQTKFVVGKALKVGLKPIVVDQQDRPSRRAPCRGRQRGVRPLRRARRHRRAARLPDPLRFGPRRLGVGEPGRPEGPGPGAAVRPRRQARAGADRASRPVPHDRHDARSQPVPRPHHHRPHRIRLAEVRTRPVKVLASDGTLVETGRISKILAFRGLERQPIDEAQAGDIVAIAGLSKGTVADTFCDPAVTEPLHAQPIDPPTVTMSFLVNDSPLAGTEGDKVTSRVIRDRLLREAEGNVALKIEESPEQGFVLRVRPRRIAACRADRDDAPRGLRARRVASARRHAEGRERRAAGADRGSRHRRRRGACRHRRAEDVASARPRWSSCARPAATASASSSTRRRAA